MWGKMPGHFLFSLLLNTELLVREGLLNGLPSIISGFLFLWVHSWWCRQSNYLCTSDDARRSSTQRPHLLWLKQFLVLHKKMQTFFLEKNLRQPSFVLKVSSYKKRFLPKRGHTQWRGGCVHVISDNLFFVCHGLLQESSSCLFESRNFCIIMWCSWHILQWAEPESIQINFCSPLLAQNSFIFAARKLTTEFMSLLEF